MPAPPSLSQGTVAIFKDVTDWSIYYKGNSSPLSIFRIKSSSVYSMINRFPFHQIYFWPSSPWSMQLHPSSVYPSSQNTPYSRRVIHSWFWHLTSLIVKILSLYLPMWSITCATLPDSARVLAFYDPHLRKTPLPLVPELLTLLPGLENCDSFYQCFCSSIFFTWRAANPAQNVDFKASYFACF